MSSSQLPACTVLARGLGSTLTEASGCRCDVCFAGGTACARQLLEAPGSHLRLVSMCQAAGVRSVPVARRTQMRHQSALRCQQGLADQRGAWLRSMSPTFQRRSAPSYAKRSRTLSILIAWTRATNVRRRPRTTPRWSNSRIRSRAPNLPAIASPSPLLMTRHNQ